MFGNAKNECGTTFFKWVTLVHNFKNYRRDVIDMSNTSTLEHREQWSVLINDFVQESMTNLERSEVLVESLGYKDTQLIKQNIRVLFRTFHTIKGVAGFLKFATLQELTHEVETLFDNIRKRPILQSDNVLQTIYKTFDCVRFILGVIGKSGSDISAREHVESMIQEIQQLIAPENRVSFDGNSIPLELISKTTVHENGESAFDTSHLDATAIAAMHEKIAILLDATYTLNLAENAQLHCYELQSIINELIETSHLSDDSEPHITGQSASAFLTMIAAGDVPLNDNTLQTAQAQIRNFIDSFEVFLQKQTSLMTSTFRLSALPSSIPEPSKDTQEEEEIEQTFSGSTYTDRSEIRVETVKLDRLFDLMSELVTLQTMTLNNPDLNGLELPNFQKSATMLAKNIRQLQSITMSMRMTPVETLFAKMKRITREVSTQLGKHVELHTSGADTEMDKNIIELLFDPLVHIFRNAIDHGIESPEERAAKGKAPTGMLHISAMYEGNEILIAVRDDGAGLNRTRILHRAVERGIAPPTTESLTDEKVWNFIFEPGFSTAVTVTGVSGRGVGMDVVKQNLTKMRGSVQVHSREGKGATITLRIPLTLASMDVILMRVGETHYAVPVGAVRQSFRPDNEDITRTMDGLELVRVRESLYTVVRLHEIFQQPSAITDVEKGILVIVEANGHKVCLFADEIVGQQQTVIKPLAKYIGDVAGLNGCMILSDGTIGLILDVEELIRIAEESAEEPA